MNMTQKDFQDLARGFFSDIVELLMKKGKTYSEEGAFDNFVKAAQVLGITKEQYLMTLVTKHYLALLNISNGEVEQDYDGAQSRISDIIIYMVLLQAMFYEKEVTTWKNNEEGVSGGS